VADRVTFCFDLVAVRDVERLPGQGPVPASDATKVPGCVDNAKPRADERRPM
jgi:hypothetical protein